MLPISRSANGFCQGLFGAVSTSWMPIGVVFAGGVDVRCCERARDSTALRLSSAADHIEELTGPSGSLLLRALLNRYGRCFTAACSAGLWSLHSALFRHGWQSLSYM